MKMYREVKCWNIGFFAKSFQYEILIKKIRGEGGIVITYKNKYKKEEKYARIRSLLRRTFSRTYLKNLARRVEKGLAARAVTVKFLGV